MNEKVEWLLAEAYVPFIALCLGVALREKPLKWLTLFRSALIPDLKVGVNEKVEWLPEE